MIECVKRPCCSRSTGTAGKEKLWSFVGPGHGAYEPQLSYEYVGDGKGSFHKTDLFLESSWRFRPCCRSVCTALVFGGMLWIFWLLWPREEDMIVPTSATTTAPFDCQEGERDWEQSWGALKKQWCCVHFERGCPKQLVTSLRATTPAPPQSTDEAVQIVGPD